MTALLHRQFFYLSIGTALLFVMACMFAWSGNKVVWTSATLQQATSNISSIALIKMIGMEVPAFESIIQVSEEQENSTVKSFFFQLATGIQPGDMRSLLGRELPGLLTSEDARILVKGQGLELSDLYVESAVPHDIESGEETQADKAEATPQDADKTAPMPVPDQVAGNRQVFIYNSHNRESWKSMTTTKYVEHPRQNMMLVSKRFAQALRDRGIKASVSADDIYQKLVDQQRSKFFSYAESLRSIRTAMSQNRNLYYFFDLHRDGDRPKEKTTISINGKKYAKILFVIGTGNKNYEKNYTFAEQFHKLLEKKYPGLSLGVIAKARDGGNNGEYNQSVSPGSLLIEVGATKNTPEECFNTAEAMADVFAEYYMQAERVSAPQKKNAEKR